MASFKINLGSKKIDGSRQVYIRLAHNSSSERIKIPVCLLSRQIGKNGEIIDRKAFALVNDYLYLLQDRANSIGVALSGMSAKDVADVIWNEYKNEEKESKFFLDWVKWLDEVIAEKKKNRGRTWESYKNARNSFVRWMEYAGIEQLDINDIKKSTAMEYMEWMKDVANVGARGREAYFVNLIAAHNMAKKRYNDDDEEVTNIPRSPFQQVDFRVPASDKSNRKESALSPMALRYLWEVPYCGMKRVDRARDVFFMSFMLCGMNTCDMFALETMGEKGVIEYDRSKVVERIGDAAHIRLEIPKEIASIVKKYKGRRSQFCFQDELSDEQSFNKTVNQGMKVWLENAMEYWSERWNVSKSEAKKKMGLTDMVTFYTARHSWATIAINDCGINMDLVDRCLCHVTDSVASKSYVKRDYAPINEANKRVIAEVMNAKI